MRGTPLRRFGAYLVTQPRRGRGAFWEVYDADGERVLYSESHASANEAARRLATGRPLLTPDESRARSIARYSSIYPSRFAWFDHTYLTNGNGLAWINGGLVDTDVTLLTPEGCAMVDERQKRAREERRATAPAWRRTLDEHEDQYDAEEAALSARYLAGGWPDVTADRSTLYPASEDYSCMGELLTMPTASVAPEWLDDARAAMRMLLAHGRDGDHRDTLATLREWVPRLAARHGGEWLQTATA